MSYRGEPTCFGNSGGGEQGAVSRKLEHQALTGSLDQTANRTAYLPADATLLLFPGWSPCWCRFWFTTDDRDSRFAFAGCPELSHSARRQGSFPRHFFEAPKALESG